MRTPTATGKIAVSDRVNAKYYASGKSSVQCAQLHNAHALWKTWQKILQRKYQDLCLSRTALAKEQMVQICAPWNWKLFRCTRLENLRII
jgi:hypothetical protein